MSNAVFKACYADWKLIKGRKVVQIVMEIPLELSGVAFKALDGMPDPGKSVWCAIARLKDEAEPVRSEPSTEKPKRTFDELPLPQQAALLCQDKVFHAFLREERGFNVRTDDEAAIALRSICKVVSRAELRPDTPAAAAFDQLRGHYDAWRFW